MFTLMNIYSFTSKRVPVRAILSALRRLKRPIYCFPHAMQHYDLIGFLS
jgi:hypothetical protein